MQSDPLFATTAVTAMPHTRWDAFLLRATALPLDPLFALDPPGEPKVKSPSETLPTAKPLALHSTLVGARSGVAIINGTVHAEGTTLRHGSEDWLLHRVEPDRVTLTRSGSERVLTIDPFRLGSALIGTAP